jgi:hypothetical protein
MVWIDLQGISYLLVYGSGGRNGNHFTISVFPPSFAMRFGPRFILTFLAAWTRYVLHLAFSVDYFVWSRKLPGTRRCRSSSRHTILHVHCGPVELGVWLAEKGRVFICENIASKNKCWSERRSEKTCGYWLQVATRAQPFVHEPLVLFGGTQHPPPCTKL